ncbi:unnamed protein product [Lathyrus oleraceus]
MLTLRLFCYVVALSADGVVPWALFGSCCFGIVVGLSFADGFMQLLWFQHCLYMLSFSLQFRRIRFAACVDVCNAFGFLAALDAATMFSICSLCCCSAACSVAAVCSCFFLTF